MDGHAALDVKLVCSKLIRNKSEYQETEKSALITMMTEDLKCVAHFPRSVYQATFPWLLTALEWPIHCCHGTQCGFAEGKQICY